MKSRRITHASLLTLVSIVVSAYFFSAFAQGVSASNVSRSLGNGRWEWIVYINAPPQVLGQIDCVEYTLHPTFPRPVQRVCAIGDQHRPFGLSGTGWGEFQIRIRVFMRDRRVVELTHDLKLRPSGVSH